MKTLIFFAALLYCSNTVGQTNYFPAPDFYCSSTDTSTTFTLTSATSSTNGWCHTPKGNLHILIIFMKDTSFVDPAYGGNPYQASNLSHWHPDSIPNWARGASNQLFDTDSSTIGTNKNLSLFYREMSHGQFILTGEIFPELIPTSSGTNAEAVTYINNNYPGYDWSRFDNRTNDPLYNSDNSSSTPDNEIDYVVFIKRKTPRFYGYSGVGLDTLTTNHSGSSVDFITSNGHTIEECYNSASHHHILFKHEFAHNL